MKSTAHRFAPKSQPLQLAPETASRFAATVFELADRAAAADAELWEVISSLAVSGNCAEIVRLADLRKTTAPEDILSSLKRRTA